VASSLRNGVDVTGSVRVSSTDADPDAAIACRGLSRSFTSRGFIRGQRETVALRGIDLAIPRGVVFGLLGPNGAGKTTLVRILSTLLLPSSGEARVLGFDVANEAREVRKHIGFVFGGERGLYGRLTGRQNLLYFGALNRIDAKLASRRAGELLETVGLSDRADSAVEEYSRGMKQRLHVARGLINDPELVFMDEPTIGLDPMAAQEIRALVPQLAAQGKTVFLTTHYMVEADVLCDDIALIDHGGIVAQGSPEEIKRRFSRIRVVELHLRGEYEAVRSALAGLPGVQRVAASADGMVSRLTLHVEEGVDIQPEVARIVPVGQLESVAEREPTLEEAYLSILG
jgi:ABC-2 type transport system ATP-binding protein